MGANWVQFSENYYTFAPSKSIYYMAQFFIRTKREEGKAPLYTKIRRNGMQMYVCTGIKVDIKEWNKAQRSLSAMQRYEQTDEGGKVHDLQMRVMKAIDMLYAEGKINTKDDKAIIEEALNNIVTGGTEEIKQVKKIAEIKSRNYVEQFYEYFFAGISDGSIRHGNNIEYKDGSIDVWRTFGEYLHEYSDINLTFDDIDKPFADGFTQYLQKKRDQMPNTINKNINCFRRLCNLAAMEGYNKNAVSLKVWKNITVKEDEKRAEIYLTDEEIDALYNLQLTGDNEEVRDIFVLGYFSCQRYSDYCKLREDNFVTYDKGLGQISLIQKKTRKHVNIPIVDDRVYELCDKYNYEFPEISEQKMNLKIKAVAAKLAESVPSFQEKYVTVLTAVEKRSERTYARLLEIKKSGNQFTENERKWFGKLKKRAEKCNGSPLFERNKYGETIRPKYELISSHTARRSGATNLYKLDVLSDQEIRSITGHQSQKVFEGYIRIGISEQAQRVGDKILAAKEAKKKKVDK